MVFSGSGSPIGFLREGRTGRNTMNATMIHGLKMKNLLIFLMMKKNKRREREDLFRKLLGWLVSSIFILFLYRNGLTRVSLLYLVIMRLIFLRGNSFSNICFNYVLMDLIPIYKR